MSRVGTGPVGRISGLIGFAMAAGLSMAGTVAFAQDQSGQSSGQAAPSRQQDLDSKRNELGRSRENEARIRAEILALGTERTRLAEELVKTADQIRTIEGKLAASEDRLGALYLSEAELQKALDGRRAVISELLAALQRLGRQPPPALLVRPEDALASVHSSMLLGAVLPEIRGEAEALSSDLRELERVRAGLLQEREAATRERADLDAARTRISLLVEARQQRLGERNQALVDEHRKMTALGREVASMEELLGRINEIERSRKNENAGPGASGARLSSLATLNDPGRMAPAIPFGSARGRLPLPVNGVKIKEFGERDGYGGALKGVTLSTRAGAQVTAPCDGSVVYAGPFRSYGQLLILNAGGGYHVLVAGMEKISVELGQFVLLGEPIGQMGSGGTQLAPALGAGNSQPALYVEFRKDGTSIDPGPWWAGNSGEKVRG